MTSSRSFGDQVRLLVIATIAGFGIAVYGAFQYLTLERAQEASAEDARTASVVLNSFVQGQREKLESLIHYVAQSPEASRLALSSGSDVVPLRTLRQRMRLDGLMVSRSDGRITLADGLTDAYLVQRQVQRAFRSGHQHLLLVIGQDLVLASIEPVSNGAKPVGVLTAFNRLTLPAASSLPVDNRFDVFFVSHHRVIGKYRDLDQVRLPAEGVVWQQTISGRTFWARHATLPGTMPNQHVSYVVLRPLNGTSARERTFYLLFGTVLASISLIAIVVGSTMARGVAKSLDGLVQSAKKLQIGEWPDPLPAMRDDEIGLLEETFNAMSESIQISHERLMSMVDLDPLTELMNHRRFKEVLATEVVRATATEQALGLLILDIDGFKRLNEELGHEAGDGVLCMLATSVRAEAPRFSMACRYSADQFAILLPGGDNASLRDLYSAICDLTPNVRLSAGCAVFAETGGTADSFLLAAELALARAKDNGRQQLCDFTSFQTGEFRDPSAFNRIIDDGTYATIRALAAAVDAKDPYTHGHSERVAHYASVFAEYMGLSPSEVDRIHRAGTLHDVGKIGVPDAILQKQGRLTEDELVVMKTHPALGENIVRRVPQLLDLVPGVRHHHERYDGKGYPDGLRGDEIPLEARYLAIADTFDAMTSDRPYRKGLARPIAIDEIRKGAGTQFDPTLAVAFAEMLLAQTCRAA